MNYRRVTITYILKASTKSYGGSQSGSEIEPYIKKEGKFIDHRIIDRSFTDLGYIGYGEGIDLEQLDSTKNWQFS